MREDDGRRSQKKALNLCAAPGCQEQRAGGYVYCVAHRQAQARAIKARYDERLRQAKQRARAEGTTVAQARQCSRAGCDIPADMACDHCGALACWHHMFRRRSDDQKLCLACWLEAGRQARQGMRTGGE